MGHREIISDRPPRGGMCVCLLVRVPPLRVCLLLLLFCLLPDKFFIHVDTITPQSRARVSVGVEISNACMQRIGLTLWLLVGLPGTFVSTCVSRGGFPFHFFSSFSLHTRGMFYPLLTARRFFHIIFFFFLRLFRQALRSTEDFSARVVALEASTEKLRQESQQSKAEVMT